MSIEHHSGDPLNEKFQDFVNEIHGVAQRKFPKGRLSADDDGETTFVISTDRQHQIVRIQFAKPMVWLGLRYDNAIALAKELAERAGELRLATSAKAPFKIEPL